jgi:hypothetical protein
MSNDISGADFSNAQQAHVPHSICEFSPSFLEGKEQMTLRGLSAGYCPGGRPPSSYRINYREQKS